MAGECVEFRVNYDKLTSFVQNSIGEEKFLQILSQFIETLQVGKTGCFKDVLIDLKGK